MTETTTSEAAPSVLRRFARPAKWGVGVLVAVAAIGFGAVPPVAKHYTVKIASEMLGREVSVERVHFNPFTLAAELHGVRVMEAGGGSEALGFDMLRVNAELESLIRGGPVLHELSLTGPRINVVLQGEGRHNWKDVLDRLAARPKSEDSGETVFSVGNIRISGGRIAVSDEPRGLKHELADIELGVPFVSNLPVKVDVFVEPRLAATLDGDPVGVSARSKPFKDSQETILDLSLKDFDMSPWTAYLPFEPTFRLPSGLLSTNLELSFTQQPDARPMVTLRGQVGVTRLEVQDRTGAPAIKVGEFALELADVEPFANKWHFTRLRLHQPEIDLVRLKDGGINLATLAPPPAKGDGKPAAGAEAAAAPAKQDFLLADARIREGVVRFEDRTLGEPFRARLEAINLDMRDLTNTGDMPAEIRLDYVTDGGEKIAHEDKVSLAPFVFEGVATLEAIKPARYAPYAAAALPGGELRGGQIDGAVRYRVALGEDGKPDIRIGSEGLALRDFALALKGSKEPAVKVPALDVRDLAIDVGARTVKLAELGVKGVAVSAVRLKNGRFDLMEIAGDKPKPKSEGPEWTVEVARLALENAAVRVEDRTVAKPVVLAVDGIGLQLDNLSTAKGATTQLKLDSRINRRGRLGASGALALQPLKADLKLDLRSVDLLPLQPYVLEKTKIAISRGSLSTRGSLDLQTAKNGSLLGRFRGDVGVADFASVDRLNATDFVRWRALNVGGIDLKLEPFALDVDKVALSDFYTRLILDEQGRLNMREIRGDGGEAPAAAGQAAPAAPAAPAASVVVEGPGGVDTAPGTPRAADGGTRSVELPPRAAPPPIRVGRIDIKGGNVAFSDRFIRPNYDVNLTGMAGSLVGLSSDPASIAKLDLGGKVDNAAPVKVTGELNPFRQDAHLDILATVKDFELTGLSSYSGKYVGYGIAKGKLSAELNYKIEERKLTATNQIFLDQLTFGDKVDSPDALNLPVQLAVSLLKNSRGEIDLHLPVSGTLDDPQFSVFGLVVKVLVNLIGKAITAPFALLGSVLGGGEELSQIEYAPGLARPGEAQQQKLKTLSQALVDRPALRLDVTGRADPAKDSEGLKQALLQRTVRAQKLKAMVAKGQEAPSVDDIEVGAQEYPELLKKAYKEADFKKPRNLIGLAKDLPVPEMEALMIANTAVGEGELRALAQQRAQEVKDWLMAEGQVPGERIFLLEPKVEAIAEGGQVQFSLR
ncbi:DUF748 domain-containing protein [Thauera sinica]|uniref:DUF748 domain-containing protein n=1 Tax=Thauera sinica TaxID=2665146 RepID=A0ABW1AQK2_9RHOO|nr:DUF748 domain-containing protein [Thauera sp. K11]ATE59593.1 hypothetical protein CCZ27_06215 [Thauera sp. K11]